MSKLIVKDLFKRFEKSLNPAIDHVSFSANEGEIISLLGPSGCGKTTTLRCIAGLEQPDGGDIWLDDRHVTVGSKHLIPPEKRGMGMVFQSYSIWPHMTVGENISIGLRAKGISKADAEKKVNEVLALVRLPGLASRHATDLSGGQQQRVALARSLALEPKILLFDEPLSNLDANLREEMRLDLHVLLRRLGITSIYVTHDQSEAFVLSDRILVMQSGQVVQSGSPDDIYLRPATRFVAEFVGSANVMAGTVCRMEADSAVVLLEGGQRIRVKGTGQIDEPVEVCIRSEMINLEPRGTEETLSGAIPGVVNDRVYLGDRFEYRVGIGKKTLVVDTPHSVRLNQGQIVWVRLTPEDIILIPKK